MEVNVLNIFGQENFSGTVHISQIKFEEVL